MSKSKKKEKNAELEEKEPKYVTRYKFEAKSAKPKVVTEHEVVITDERVKLNIETAEILKHFLLEPFVTLSFNIPMAYNNKTGTYDLIEEPNEVRADNYFYYYTAEPSALTTAGWYYPRIDEYRRTLTHVAVMDQIAGTLTTDANNYLETHVMLIDKQIKSEYIAGSTTALTASTPWDTGSVDATYYSQIRGFVYADQDGTLNYYVSYDGTNWHLMATKTYTAGDEVGFEYDALAKYVKVEFVNGSTGQTSFEIRVYGEV